MIADLGRRRRTVIQRPQIEPETGYHFDDTIYVDNFGSR